MPFVESYGWRKKLGKFPNLIENNGSIVQIFFPAVGFIYFLFINMYKHEL